MLIGQFGLNVSHLGFSHMVKKGIEEDCNCLFSWLVISLLTGTLLSFSHSLSLSGNILHICCIHLNFFLTSLIHFVINSSVTIKYL